MAVVAQGCVAVVVSLDAKSLTRANAVFVRWLTPVCMPAAIHTFRNPVRKIKQGAGSVIHAGNSSK